VLVELLFHITPSQREALEGFTMLLATGVLFYVSYWLVSKIEVARWNAFVRGQMEKALGAGSGLALAAVAFLAVYREGFETILFYKALLDSSGTAGLAPVVMGIALGSVLLVGIYFAVTYTGFRLPLKPFFAVTSGMLYYMAFVFAGKGMAELQGAGWVSLTPVGWGPRMPFMGVYPTLESLGVQAVLVALALVALVWARWAAPPGAAPAPVATSLPAVAEVPPAGPPTSRGGAAPLPPRRSRSSVS
jgi:high-affinity iron transporter